MASKQLRAATLALAAALCLPPISTGCTSGPADAGDAALDATDDLAADIAPDRATDAADVCVHSDAAPDAWLRDPPPLPRYSHGTCPMLRGANTATNARNDGFATATDTRSFYVLVPSSYRPDRPAPVVFGWHWLAGDAQQLIREAQLEQAVEQLGVIVVVPELLRVGDSAAHAYGFDWPFIEQWGQEPELQFFDDMLACVAGQWRIDARRVHAIGVSAGALWLTFLSTTPRVNHLASLATLSGGLGQMSGILSMHFTPQANKFPALVLWGGPTDRFVLDFQQASILYRDALRCDHHFVVQCIHDGGHAVPPLPVPDGGTRFQSVWQFLLDHPYGVGPDRSPYLDGGVPSVIPSWCSIVP